MGRYLGPKHKLCRAWGEKLCDSPKCPVLRRNYPAGAHGSNKRRPKVSGYGKQLREKQKAKRLYGLLERQFANYVAEALRKTGDTSQYLLHYLESRLDNVVYRLGLAMSRGAARQLVGHGHVRVNGRKVDISSYRVRVGDVITLSDAIKTSKLFSAVAETLAKKEFPAWLTVNPGELSGKVVGVPALLQPNFDAHLIVGFYTR